MRRYLRLLRASLRLSLLLAMQYRWDFIGHGLMQLVWTSLGVLPLWIAYQARAAAGLSALGGYSFPQALTVFGFFTLLKALLDGAINPSLTAVVEHIRTGTLDFILLKPADAQFLVSTARQEPWRIIDAATGIGFVVFGMAGHIHQGGAPPGLGALLGAGLLLLCAMLLLYSIWILVICAAFYVVRIDNLSFLFTSLFDFARWPRSVFRGALHVLFTFVVPLVLMTSYPAEALLGLLRPPQLLLAVVWTGLLLCLCRLAWRRSLAAYTSASS
ncbi:MAG: ABC-2 family transporter protein [Myxococcales bacterium]|nr:ABC-2 family transporter protein [Myxococcota bacterium]MDW8280862.1 ABC-2 family transporter protein [Myxococcales bacterium]